MGSHITEALQKWEKDAATIIKADEKVYGVADRKKKLKPHEEAIIELWNALASAAQILEAQEIPIVETCHLLMLARSDELKQATIAAQIDADVKRLENDVHWREKHVIAQAYDDGLIDGKNVETRKGQELKAVTGDSIMVQKQAEVDAKRSEIVGVIRIRSKATIRRQYWEDLLVAQKAVLYATRTEVNAEALMEAMRRV